MITTTYLETMKTMDLSNNGFNPFTGAGYVILGDDRYIASDFKSAGIRYNEILDKYILPNSGEKDIVSPLNAALIPVYWDDFFYMTSEGLKMKSNREILKMFVFRIECALVNREQL